MRGPRDDRPWPLFRERSPIFSSSSVRPFRSSACTPRVTRPWHPPWRPSNQGFPRSLRTRRTLALGVGRDELLVEGIPTDSRHPLFKNLATRLYRHELGAVTFAEGVTSEEIAQVLRLVAGDPERTGRTLGSEPESVLRGRPHIRLEPARYAELKLKARSSLSKADREKQERGPVAHARQCRRHGGRPEGRGGPGRRSASPSAAAQEVTELFRRQGHETGRIRAPAPGASRTIPARSSTRRSWRAAWRSSPTTSSSIAPWAGRWRRSRAAWRPSTRTSTATSAIDSPSCWRTWIRRPCSASCRWAGTTGRAASSFSTRYAGSAPTPC